MREFDFRKVPFPSGGKDEALPLHENLDLEIGAGVGLHAIQYASARPERFLIAIEKTRAKYHSLENRLRGHPSVKNLLPLHANAVNWVTHRVPANTLERVFLLYPNPYPKAKQANKRWQRMPFMGFLKTRMKKGAHLVLATNQAWYAEEAWEIMTQHWGFKLLSFESLPSNMPARTHFEKKYLERGEACWDLVFEKPVAE